MLSDDLRKRIAALNRAGLRNVPEEDSEGDPEQVQPEDAKPEGTPRVRVEKPPPMRVFASQADARIHVPLSEAVPGEEADNEAGQFLLISRSLEELMPGSGEGFGRRYVRAVKGLEEVGRLRTLHRSFQDLAGVSPEDVLFVDIEATGLTAGTPLFLVGVLLLADDEVHVVQMLARDYTEEAALLMHFCEVMAGSRAVVSFNGKSYDMPYIRDRSIFLGVPFQFDQGHFDLMYEARRRWRGQLPNCKLQTLERHICRRTRTGDIPGAEIPDAYHRFVQTRNAAQIRDIVHHNALDLITLAELLVFVLEGREL